MKKQSVLYKYLITYMAIILAVCVAASFSFFFVALNQYNENIDSSNVSRFAVSRQAVDSDFEECVRIANKLLTNENGVIDDVSSKETVSPSELKKVLQEYLTGNRNIMDIIMIPDMSKSSDVTYYCASGIIDSEYFDKYYGFDKITHQWIAENITAIKAPILIQTVSGGTLLYESQVNILIIPEALFVTNGKFEAVMFMFYNEKLVEQFTGSFEKGTTNVMILSSEGEMLMADSSILQDPAKYMENVPNRKKLYTDKSSMFDWTYALFVDNSVFGGYFGTTGFIVLLCISIFLILIGIAAAFVAAHYSYKPFKEIMNIFPKEFHSEENEFSIMQRIFTEMNRKNEILMENIEELKDKKLDPLAVLLTGDKTDSRVLADDLGLPSYAVGYVLGILEIDDYDKFRRCPDGDPAAVLCSCVRECIKLPTFVEGLPGKGFYVTVTALNSAGDAEREGLKTMIGEAQERIRNTFGVTVTCTLSRTFYNVADAAEIVYSVICATNYRVMYGYDSIIDMELFDKQYVSIDTEFFNCFFEFYNHLKSGDYSSVKDNLMQMKETIQESFSPDVFRLAYINIIHCFAQYLGDDEIRYELTFIPKTVDSAFDNIALLTDRFFEAQNKNVRLKSEILKIVQSEYTNSDLSISSIAEKLDISNSYLRKYFKDNMGVTLFAYIDEMRISYAKRLLFETDMPIKDIAKASGYNDINNFNRKFKAKTGKTPTAYKVNKTDEIN
ncbi:MAG: helix-turn-helix domain-containing protein [Clostridia bacterium]|nr:helix-turn-helix domain-containing protein [Clostridia bacterium]